MDKYTAEHILGLSGEYDARGLKGAYRKLAATHHPDAARRQGLDASAATAKMQQINEANDYLAGLLATSPGHTARCDVEPRPETPHATYASAPRNPFDGARSGGDSWKQRTTTAEYYASDPRYRAYAEAARQRAERAREARERHATWEYANTVPEDPMRPNPSWYPRTWRFLARFPYRLVFLMAVCLLVNLTDPLHMGPTLGPITFEDGLLALALLNLVFPIVTGPLRAGLLWLLDRARSLSWARAMR